MRLWIILGRISLFLGFVALLASWYTNIGGSLLGLDTTHFVNDAVILILLGIGLLLDGKLNSERKPKLVPVQQQQFPPQI